MVKHPEKQLIHGFSKLSRSEKLAWLKDQYGLSRETLDVLDTHLHRDPELQEIYGDLSENTVSNFYLPMGLSPNFLINGQLLTLPMVVEESSVVAAASHAAKFWAAHGGFHARVSGSSKVGQVHFTWSGDPGELHRVFENNREELLQTVKPLTRRMEQRGGGIQSLEIRPTHSALPGHYQLFATFLTANAMGANFINSVLEELGAQFARIMEHFSAKGEFSLVMSILSNYTPESLVECHVEAPAEVFEPLDPGLSGLEFARKFRQAVDIAHHDPYRAVTHNKGIFNGMDAVILATGNDFRAVEACGHAYASRTGSYRGLSRAELSEGVFRFTLEVPMAVGTVGGLTGLHPVAAASLEILGNPSAEGLMQVIAAAGLASNFSAIRALVTSGIQQGHMRMHLGNILRQLQASREESDLAARYFAGRSLSHAEVAAYLESLRQQKPQE
jgi:hydroxymethylglutaryl-CoA reductase